MPIAVGDVVEHRFVVETEQMAAFQALSNDYSRIHTDDEYAHSRGFKGAIVYGGIMMAHLSYVLGSKIPGSLGTSGRWQVDYRAPLYVGDSAVLRLEVTYVSKPMGVIQAKFTIRAREGLVATGTVQSFVPETEIAGE